MKYGFNPQLEKDHKTPEDWIYGAISIPCITDIPEDEREKYLPQGEIQNLGEEKMDCASRAPINVLEAKFTWLYQNKKLSLSNTLWLVNKGYVQGDRVLFSDRFIAIKSNTTTFGNSMIAPLKTIHQFGLIPKSMFPQVKRFDEYYDRKLITQEMLDLGAEFVIRFPIFYEQVFEVHFGELLKEDFLIVAGYAWPEPVDGEYPRTEGNPNHVFTGFKVPKYYIFDNYENFQSFVKKLAPDYDLVDYGYRVFIQEWKGEVDKPSLIKRVINFIIKLFKKSNV